MNLYQSKLSKRPSPLIVNVLKMAHCLLFKKQIWRFYLLNISKFRVDQTIFNLENVSITLNNEVDNIVKDVQIYLLECYIPPYYKSWSTFVCSIRVSTSTFQPYTTNVMPSFKPQIQAPIQFTMDINYRE